MKKNTLEPLVAQNPIQRGKYTGRSWQAEKTNTERWACPSEHAVCALSFVGDCLLQIAYGIACNACERIGLEQLLLLPPSSLPNSELPVEALPFLFSHPPTSQPAGREPGVLKATTLWSPFLSLDSTPVSPSALGLPSIKPKAGLLHEGVPTHHQLLPQLQSLLPLSGELRPTPPNPETGFSLKVYLWVHTLTLWKVKYIFL